MIIDYLIISILIIVALIDLKYKAVPSVVLTGTLFVIAILDYLLRDGVGFELAFISGLFSLLIWEFADSNDMSFGIADIKIMIVIGFLLKGMNGLFAFLIAFAFIQFTYIFIVRKMFKSQGELPFLPALLGVYIGLYIGGYVGW